MVSILYCSPDDLPDVRAAGEEDVVKPLLQQAGGLLHPTHHHLGYHYTRRRRKELILLSSIKIFPISVCFLQQCASVIPDSLYRRPPESGNKK